ncbi:hypothetical protein OJF2_15950 [Aquisphaera giovannonii]|uniref:Uncharacterized protein n=1 Tax=Aquisphaera giovannonii TaxID=406548 RepID=A0A5B9VXT0_9BACT|nr:hypothetical protein [Aquisphaera giovannonii]QEH33098.1 hypothetical protein OJF2_15950 [Aquisphaera giovannonii]
MRDKLARKFRESWSGRLSHYRMHRNDEHLAALFEETVLYVGLHLENDLCRSDHWSEVRLDHAAAIVLFLVDKGVVERATRYGRRVFEPLPHAESWVSQQPALRRFQEELLELILALRHELARRSSSRRSRPEPRA